MKRASVVVRELHDVHDEDFDVLVHEANAGGFSFVERLVREWRSGVNRFDRRGEKLFGAWRGDDLVGCGGVNVDPYANDPQLGRIRHVYVAAAHRRSGVGRALLEQLLEHARAHFLRVRLKTETIDAVRFYETFGFQTEVGTGGFVLAMRLGT